MEFVIQAGSPPTSFHSDRNGSTSSPSSTIQSGSQLVYTGRSLAGFSDGNSGRSLVNNVDGGSDFVYSGQGITSDRYQHMMSGSMEGQINSTQQIVSAANIGSGRGGSQRVANTQSSSSGSGPRVIIARGGNKHVVDMKNNNNNKMNVGASPFVVAPSAMQPLSTSSAPYMVMPTAMNMQQQPQFQPSPMPQQQPHYPPLQPQFQQQLSPIPQQQQPLINVLPGNATTSTTTGHYDPMVLMQFQQQQQQAMMYQQMQAYQLQQQQQQQAFLYSQLQAQQQQGGAGGGATTGGPPPGYNTQYGGNTAALSDAFGRLSAANHATPDQDGGEPSSTGYKTRSRRGGVKARQRAAARRAWEEEMLAKQLGGGDSVVNGDGTDGGEGGAQATQPGSPASVTDAVPQAAAADSKPRLSEPSTGENGERNRRSEKSANGSDRPRLHDSSKSDSTRSRDGPKSRGKKLYSSKKSNDNDNDLDADLEDALDITPTIQLVPTRPLLKVLAKECKPRPPWFCGYPFAGCSGPDAPTLTEELIAFSRFVSPSPYEFDRLSMHFNKCLGLFQRLWPDCEFRLASITAAGVVPPKGCPLQVYAVHTHDFAVAIESGDYCEQQSKLEKAKRKMEKRLGSNPSTDGGSGRPMSSQPSDGDQILERLLALPASAVPQAAGTAGTRESVDSCMTIQSAPVESLYLPFAPLLDTCIERISKSADDIPEGNFLLAEELIRSHVESANLECAFHKDARNCSVVVISDTEDNIQIAIRFGPRAVLSEKTSILLRRQIAHNYHARLALCAMEALLRQNNLVDNDGTKPNLLSAEALAILMLTVVKTKQMDRHSTTKANPANPHPIPHAGGLLNSFLHIFGLPTNFDPMSHTADYMVGLNPPSKRLHPDAKFSVCDPSDDPRVHVSFLNGVYHTPIHVAGATTKDTSAPSSPTDDAPTPRNLASTTSDTRHLAAVLNYCYAAMEAHETSAPPKRKAQSILSTIIGGEAYWGRVLELYEHVVEPWYGVVHHLRRILAKSLTDAPPPAPAQQRQ